MSVFEFGEATTGSHRLPGYMFLLCPCLALKNVFFPLFLLKTVLCCHKFSVMSAGTAMVASPEILVQEALKPVVCPNNL